MLVCLLLIHPPPSLPLASILASSSEVLDSHCIATNFTCLLCAYNLIIMLPRLVVALASLAILLLAVVMPSNAFFTNTVTRSGGSSTSFSNYSSSALSVFGQQRQQQSSQGLSPLPRGISPFEKGLSKNIDIQGEFRKRAKRSIDIAISTIFED